MRTRTATQNKTRILSAFMAFLIFALSFQHLFVGWGLRVGAIGGDGYDIYSTTKTTTIKTNGTNSSDTRFTYTGKITRAQTELFDYVSDYELINNSYNNIIHTEGGYDDAYTSFNNAISQSNNATTPLHAYTDNITITLETTSFSDRVFIYLFKDSNNNGWPGKQMTYDSANNRYTYTFSRSSTNTSSPYWLNFTPDRIIFTDGTNDANTVKSRTISQTMSNGNTYSFVETNLKSNNIIYQYQDGAGQDNLHIHYWLDDDHHSAWNGPSFPWDNGTNTYLYEVDTSTLGYVPTNFLFNKGPNNDDWKTSDLPYNGKTTRKGFTYYCKWDGALAVDEYLNSTFSLSDSSQQSQPIYGTKYTNPLYFGCFWRSNTADASNTTNYPSSSNPGYNANNKAAYNNFWWQINMGLKTINDENNENNNDHFKVRGTASTQGLVHSSLVNNNLADPVNTTTELPYFKKDSSLVTNGLMKYYDNDETGDDIQFPFYEVRSAAATNVGSGTDQLAGTYQNYTGAEAKTQYAKFYQFDSKESNLRFQIAENESNQEDPSLHQGHFVETSQAITHGSSAGYFPFNNYNKKNENQHNLGFGTKFQMTFKLQPDGCVGVVDDQGNDLNPNKYKTRVHTIFEFEGDDDLWVFIDGNLVLDMGGAHLKSHGIIDFADQTATVNKAIKIGDHRSGYTGNDKDDLGVAYGSNVQVNNTTPSVNYFKNCLTAENSFMTVDDGGVQKEVYNPNTPHTLTVFYMERGMLDSNLLIRFNYTPEANFSKMKIAEVTDFSSVNNGLQSFTKKAAENDVFKYTVENKGTVKSDVLTDTSAQYPTTDQRDRKNEIDSTISTRLFNQNSTVPKTIPYIPPGQLSGTTWTDSTERWSTVCGTSYLWVDENTVNSLNVSSPKMVGKTTGSTSNIGPNGCETDGELFLMYGTCNDLYPQGGLEKVGKESSAEFEKTFTRDSTMRVTQAASLYTPDRSQNPASFTVSGRSLADYYSTAVRLIDRAGNLNKTLVNDGVNDVTTDPQNHVLNNGGQFKFNNASNVNTSSSVQLTEYFVNSVKTGSITVSKSVSGESNSEYFQFKLTLTNVFGVADNNVGANEYDGITITGAFDSTGTSISTLEADGTFYVQPGTIAEITGIPYSTHYKLEEVSAIFSHEAGSGSDALEGNMTEANSTIDKNLTVVNTRMNANLTLKKTLGENASAYHNDGDNFTFDVTLTLPSSVSSGSYTINGNPTSISNGSTFTVNVPAGATGVTLSGIPCGTTYTVTENSASSTGTSSVTVNDSSTTPGTITSGGNTVIITNNYPAPEHNLKNKEVTDFKDVNQGLLSLTMQAADSDVFKYTIKNKGTVNGDVQDSGIQTPTYDYYTRTNDDADTTKNTALTGKSFLDTDAIYLRATMSDGSLWDKDGARIGAYLSGEGNTAKSILADDVIGVDHYYRIPLGSYTSVKLLRISNNYDVDQLPVDMDISTTSGNVWNSSQIVTLNRGSTYSISKDNWNKSYEYSSDLREYIEYSTNNFTPGDTYNAQDNPVANTNYIWKEAYASKNNNGQTDDAIDGMTNTTDGSGNFWLMYGTDAAESSAEFVKQFKVHTDASHSVMTVIQNNTLSTPANRNSSPAVFNDSSPVRNVSAYYTTTVSATDTAGTEISVIKTDNNSNTVYNYKNADSTTSSTVSITETFTNTVNVGAITVEKKILIPGSDPAEYLDEDTGATFTFRIQLKEVFGDSTLNVGTTNSPYSGVSAIRIKKDGSEDTSFTGLTEVTEGAEKYGQFALKNGEKLVISGIPVGTNYKITETSISDPNYEYSAGNMSDFETVAQGTINENNVSTYANNNETIVNIRKTGALSLKKTLGENAGINGKTPATEFRFNVTLTAPEGVDLTDYITGLTGFDHYEHTEGTRNYSFSKQVRDNNSTVDISSIPYGTTYTVTEDSGSSAGTISVTVSDSSTVTPGTIDEASSTVTITNDYPVKTVTLSKVDPSKDNALIGTGSATFQLLRLPNGFNKNDPADITALTNAVANINTQTYATVVGTYTTTNGRIIISEGSGTNSSPYYYNFTFDNNSYFFYETAAPSGYHANNTVTTDKIFRFEENEYDIAVSYPNLPDSSSIDVKKVDKDDQTTLLKDAEFELWYKDVRTPPTYSINESVISPNYQASKSLLANTQAPTEISNTESISVDKYDYTAVSAPSATETSWILPRSDNDYIYFRDYNTGSKYSGDFGWGNNNEDDDRRWINMKLGSNDYGQNDELIYDTSKWLKAKFTAAGKPSVEYAVWERFVDDYNGKKTVVWKIQPPDGYENVEFILCQGNNHIRNTVTIPYVLGNIYTKTNKGKYNGGQYGYPVIGEHWSTNWNGTGESYNDNRMSYSAYNTSPNTTTYVFSGANDTTNAFTAPKQTKRYTATPQKVVFHCNSKKVWHNIHIEFFGADGTTHIGQDFPGYMMEPYAYAGSDYRINGYLTYELTIPEDAHYFRINNGVNSDQTYGFYTQITPLGSGDTNKYFKIKSSDTSGDQKGINLVSSTSFATNPGKTYSDNEEIESDCDYIYFAKPNDDTAWGDHIYAYFYGGGNLREDNWQRACYSVWPGVAPAGSKFNDGAEYDATIYNYSSSANPDTTFSFTKDGKTYTVYKFRLPLGETKNYSKVIFNNGLDHVTANNRETSVISYKAGYLYYPNGSSQKMYENKPTYTYTGRGDSLYVRMASGDLANWDDLHVTFYNSNGTQILQGGDGYVMKYSGTQGSYTYFSIPIPANAAKFSVNNGINKSGSHVKTADTVYEILPNNPDATADEINSSPDTFTKGDMLYTLSGTALTKELPQFTKLNETVTTSNTTAYPSPRGDYIYIKDPDGTNLSGTLTFTFYSGENGETQITGTTPKVNTHVNTSTPHWYSVGIPTNATKFSMNGGTEKYDIYPRSAGSTNEYTPGGMYYEATGNNTLNATPLWPTFDTSYSYTIYHEDDWGTDARGDTLYLVYDSIPSGGIVSVTFKNSSGSIIKKGTEDSIKATYIGQLTGETPEVAGVSTSESNAVGHWFKVNIPNNAATFTATANGTEATGDIYRLRQTPARYHKDYTLGDMQYRISGTKAERFYPVFTEDDVYTQTIGNQTLDTTSGVILVDETQVPSAYYTAAESEPEYTPITSSNASTTDSYVLHQTTSNTVTYTWQEGTEDPYLYLDISNLS